MSTKFDFNLFLKTRRALVLIRGVFGLLAAIITVFVINHEFPELADNPQYLLLLMTWGGYGILLLLMEYKEAKKKALDEKIEDLIKEIKLDREERGKEMQDLIKEIRQERNEQNHKPRRKNL